MPAGVSTAAAEIFISAELCQPVLHKVLCIHFNGTVLRLINTDSAVHKPQHCPMAYAANNDRIHTCNGGHWFR